MERSRQLKLITRRMVQKKFVRRVNFLFVSASFSFARCGLHAKEMRARLHLFVIKRNVPQEKKNISMQ